MPRPTQFPEWATDAVFSVGPETGNPTRETPPDGYLAQGFTPGKDFPSEYANWLLGLSREQINFLFRQVYQTDEEHYYENAKPRHMVVTMGDGYPFLGSSLSEWSGFAGLQRNSTADGARWLIPLRGIPSGARIDRIDFRASTNNAARAGNKALFRLLRASFAAATDYLQDLNGGPSTGANPFWEVVTPSGISAPGPYSVEFPSIGAGQVFAYFNGPPLFLAEGYMYAIEVIAGSDFGTHVSDSFYPCGITWTSFGPRSG